MASPEKRKAAAQAARALLDNEAFVDVMESIKAESVELLFTAKYGSDQLADAHLKAQAYNIVLSSLKSRIDDGKLIKDDLDHG